MKARNPVLMGRKHEKANICLCMKEEHVRRYMRQDKKGMSHKMQKEDNKKFDWRDKNASLFIPFLKLRLMKSQIFCSKKSTYRKRIT